MALHNFPNNNYISVLEKQEKVANPNKILSYDTQAYKDC